MAVIETETKPETFPVTFNMPKQRVWDLLCCGMESGSYGSFTIIGYGPRAADPPDGESRWCETNECERPECHRCNPIQGCTDHDKCQEDRYGEAFRGYGEFPHIETPFQGGAVLLKDRYGDSETVYRLDREALQRGLKIMGEKYPHLMGDFVNENEDAITGDAFIQCALLGEIVYG